MVVRDDDVVVEMFVRRAAVQMLHARIGDTTTEAFVTWRALAEDGGTLRPELHTHAREQSVPVRISPELIPAWFDMPVSCLGCDAPTRQVMPTFGPLWDEVGMCAGCVPDALLDDGLIDIAVQTTRAGDPHIGPLVQGIHVGDLLLDHLIACVRDAARENPEWRDPDVFAPYPYLVHRVATAVIYGDTDFVQDVTCGDLTRLATMLAQALERLTFNDHHRRLERLIDALGDHVAADPGFAQKMLASEWEQHRIDVATELWRQMRTAVTLEPDTIFEATGIPETADIVRLIRAHSATEFIYADEDTPLVVPSLAIIAHLKTKNPTQE